MPLCGVIHICYSSGELIADFKRAAISSYSKTRCYSLYLGDSNVPDYDLSKLSSRSFEQLIQSLAIRVLGPGIVVFGDGPDGGREATFERKLNYPTPEDAWDGYGVVQAKFRQRLGSTREDGSWAVEQLKEEIRKYTDPNSNLRSPDYFIYATNVVLTPVNEKGSKDRVIAVLEDLKKQTALKGYAVWDYDQIRAFLDAYEDVRNAYEAFITPGDVLAKIIDLLQPKPSDLRDILLNFLEKDFLRDQFVNLGQAGHDSEGPIHLATVFVDLPTSNEHSPVVSNVFDNDDFDSHSVGISTPHQGGFIKDILAVSAERLDPAHIGASTLANSFELEFQGQSRGRYVLIGGPGQGKTTLTQFICQIFRASIISQQSPQAVSAEALQASATIQRHCDIEGIDHLVVPRFPFKIILSDFARALTSSATPQVNSVLGYLVRQIRTRTDEAITVNDLRRFLSNYPSVMIFDGLDEVPASSNRGQVLDAIRDFWIDASGANADILAIATSRPQGYNEDFSPLYYRHQQLAELSDELSWHVAQRLAEVRYRLDENRKERVLERLGRAVRDESTARLMRSPLQVTIMAALVDRIGQPPQARWDLFRLYYDVIYDREVERSIPASHILREYRPDIRAIHNQVGLILQIDSERTGRTDAKLSRERFMSLVGARLSGEGHPDDDLNILAGHIVEAVSQRLVFLVEVESEQIGFEIRSLQEFMAAESLMDGADESIRRRLDEIAATPFWRNVFLFAAGKCFAERQELREVVHLLCAGLNETDSDGIAGTYLAGSDLAIALLEEGSPARQPKFENLLTRIAIRALDTANPSVQIRLANVYRPQSEDTFHDEIKLRLAGTDKIRSTGAWNCLLQLIANGVPWAKTLANENWPQDLHDQIVILQSVAEPTRNPWAVDKILCILPHTPVETFRDHFQLMRGRDFGENRNLTPTEEAAVSALRLDLRPVGPEIDVLGTGVFYGPLIRANGGNHNFLQRFREIDGWHPSWNRYKWAAHFAEAPSKERLSSALVSIASDFEFGTYESAISGRFMAPWPILACLASCEDRAGLLVIAQKAEKGELGDFSDWTAAEDRWFNAGITLQDLLAMPDTRLPFDPNIAEAGFPTTLSMLSAMIAPDLSKTKLEDLVEVFTGLPAGRTRTFVAGLINWVVFAHTFAGRLEGSLELPQIDVVTLQSIYQEVPDGSPVPLHFIVNLVGESSHEIAGFFEAIEAKDFVYDTYGGGDSRSTEQSLRVLRKAYTDIGQPPSLLRILGSLAEHGYLTGHYIDVKNPQSLERSSDRLAALVIMLSQADWRTEHSQRLTQTAQEVGVLSQEDFDRVVNTLERRRSVGDGFDEFVVALKRWMPLDDYKSGARYVDLLRYSLSKRTSQFSNPHQVSQFALPDGVVELITG